MRFTYSLINVALAKVALLGGILYAGSYLASITWYWLFPVSATVPEVVAEMVESKKVKVEDISLKTTLDSILRYNPWGKLPEPEPEVVPQPPKKKVEKAVVSKLNVELVGTMVQDGERSVAFLVDRAGSRKSRRGKQKMMYVGDRIQGADLEKIERNAVYLRNGTQLEIVKLKSELLERDGLLPESLREQKRSDRTISRKEWNTMIDQGVSLLRGLEITPFYRGRHAIGYRMNIIAKRPAYQKVGVLSGDIIQSVNGTSVMDKREILAMLPKLRTSGKIEVQIMRNHKPETIVIRID